MSEKFSLFTSLRYDPALLGVPPQGLKRAGWNAEVSSPFYMLDYHRDRMLRAATHWGWTAAADAISGPEGLERLGQFILSVLGEVPATPLRVKVILAEDGELGLEKNDVPALPLANLFPAALPAPEGSGVETTAADAAQRDPVYEVILDRDGTARSEHTHFKTTHRPVYDSARQRAGLSLADRKEVLIVNGATGAVMEGSMTTPYFWRGGRWVTPPVSARYSAEAGSGGQDGTTRRWALERNLAVEGEVTADSLTEGEECWISNGVRGFIFGRVTVKSARSA